MAGIIATAAGFQVEADLLGEEFDLPPEEIAERMRDGRITSRCEKGEGADAGRWRLTFFHAGRALRLTLGADFQILSRASFDAPRQRRAH